MRITSTSRCFSNSSSKYFSSTRKRVYKNPTRNICTPLVKTKNALRCRRAFGYTGSYKELWQVFAFFLINRNMPKFDNRSCECGLALEFGFHQNTGVVSKHVGQYST